MATFLLTRGTKSSMGGRHFQTFRNCVAFTLPAEASMCGALFAIPSFWSHLLFFFGSQRVWRLDGATRVAGPAGSTNDAESKIVSLVEGAARITGSAGGADDAESQ
jgi:hypothetical protein